MDNFSSQNAEPQRPKYDFEGVCFDPEEIALEGSYSDELSLYRAKKNWSQTLESAFLLESGRDFVFETTRGIEKPRYILKCVFTTACGRYAFWRLTNNQAPEAQYEIETAHIPNSASRHEDFISAPDLRPISSEPSVLSGLERTLDNNKSFADWLQAVIDKIGKTF